MASKSRAAFEKNCKDIERLMEIHTDLGGTGQGRRHQLEVLNKSAIVLICAVWEAYCEDLVSEAVENIVVHGKATGLTKDIKKTVAKELKDELNEIAVWDLAGDGWRIVLRNRLAKLQRDRNWNFNSPKTAPIKILFKQALGIEDITAKWSWAGMSVSRAGKKLDAIVELRGSIAHRGAAAQACNRDHVTDSLNHVTRLVGNTGMHVNTHVKKLTGKGLW